MDKFNEWWYELGGAEAWNKEGFNCGIDGIKMVFKAGAESVLTPDPSQLNEDEEMTAHKVYESDNEIYPNG